MNKKCSATSKSGEQCEAQPVNGSEFCFFHHPDKAEERKAASAAGGKAGAPKTLPPDTPWVTVRTPGDVSQQIEATINRVVRGEISPQVANSIAILLALQLKARELQMNEERLDALEMLVEDHRRSTLTRAADGCKATTQSDRATADPGAVIAAVVGTCTALFRSLGVCRLVLRRGGVECGP